MAYRVAKREERRCVVGTAETIVDHPDIGETAAVVVVGEASREPISAVQNSRWLLARLAVTLAMHLDRAAVCVSVSFRIGALPAQPQRHHCEDGRRSHVDPP